MEMLADLRQIADRLDQPHRNVPRMRARKPDALDARHLVDGFQKRREVARRVVRGLVVVDDLPQQLDFSVDLISGADHFLDDVPSWTHALVPARVRDDAKGTELVAPLDNGDERLDWIVASRQAERK